MAWGKSEQKAEKLILIDSREPESVDSEALKIFCAIIGAKLVEMSQSKPINFMFRWVT